jgi:hypothetical protein
MFVEASLSAEVGRAAAHHRGIVDFLRMRRRRPPPPEKRLHPSFVDISTAKPDDAAHVCACGRRVTARSASEEEENTEKKKIIESKTSREKPTLCRVIPGRPALLGWRGGKRR